MAPSPLPRAVALLALLGFAANAWAGSKPARSRGPAARTGRAAPPFSELVKAAKKNDRGALERLASRMGVSRLAEGARGADAAVAQASLTAIPLARGGVLLTGSVAERLDAGDPALAAAAARALGALLDGDHTTELAEWEVPPDVTARGCNGLRALAARADAPAPARLAAIDALALSQPTCAGATDLAALMRDPAPAVRRAAALVLRPSDPSAAAALRAGLGDPDPKVTSACVATVCRRVDAAAARRKGDALVEQAITAARALVASPATLPEDAVEMLACVAAAGTPADRALLEKLRHGAPPAVRARAVELTGGTVPGKPE